MVWFSKGKRYLSRPSTPQVSGDGSPRVLSIPRPNILPLLPLQPQNPSTSHGVSGSQGKGTQGRSTLDHGVSNRNMYSEYLGSLPWRWNIVLWYKHHSLPRGAVQKLCHNLENLLHFLKRKKEKKKTVFPRSSQIMKTGKCTALPNPNGISLCCRNILNRQKETYLFLNSLHTRPWDNRVTENKGFGLD